MSHLTIALSVIGLVAVARFFVARRRAVPRVLEETVRPFEPTALTHQGWVDTAAAPACAPPARPGERAPFAIRCTVRLVPGDRERGMALRKWRVVERKVEANPFGLRVSTGEIIAVQLEAIDERVVLELRPAGGADGHLDCVAKLADGDRVEIDGAVETNGDRRVLRARHLSVLPAGPVDADAPHRKAQAAKRWVLVVGMVAFAGLSIVTALPTVVPIASFVTLAIILWIDPHRPHRHSSDMAYNPIAIRQLKWLSRRARAAMAEPPIEAVMPNYTTLDVIRLPLDVVAPRPTSGVPASRTPQGDFPRER